MWAKDHVLYVLRCSGYQRLNLKAIRRHLSVHWKSTGRLLSALPRMKKYFGGPGSTYRVSAFHLPGLHWNACRRHRHRARLVAAKFGLPSLHPILVADGSCRLAHLHASAGYDSAPLTLQAFSLLSALPQAVGLRASWPFPARAPLKSRKLPTI